MRWTITKAAKGPELKLIIYHEGECVRVPRTDSFYDALNYFGDLIEPLIKSISTMAP